MSSWMDFIGKGYYTIPKFIEESQKYGITRRIALLSLMAINYPRLKSWVSSRKKIMNTRPRLEQVVCLMNVLIMQS